VGQVPSHLEDQFTDYLQTHGKRLQFSQCADPCSAQLGLVLRAQQAGDIVLSRPVLVAEAWADRCWHTTERCVPRRLRASQRPPLRSPGTCRPSSTR
jgi:hypothetical protein